MNHEAKNQRIEPRNMQERNHWAKKRFTQWDNQGVSTLKHTETKGLIIIKIKNNNNKETILMEFEP